jgi:hypothetical protein
MSGMKLGWDLETGLERYIYIYLYIYIYIYWKSVDNHAAKGVITSYKS